MRALALLPIAFTLSAAQEPARPAPPPAFVHHDCWPGPWIIFFDRNAAVPNREGQAILQVVIDWNRGACGPLRLTITGHAEQGERPGIDRRRAVRVRSYLGRHGIPYRRITVRSAGTAAPRVPPQRGTPEIQNRRVEITADGIVSDPSE